MSVRIHSRVSEIDMEKCVEQAGGNRFELIIMASARAREIKRNNTNSDRHEHLHTPVTALLEFQEGKLNRDYIKKLKK